MPISKYYEPKVRQNMSNIARSRKTGRRKHNGFRQPDRFNCRNAPLNLLLHFSRAPLARIMMPITMIFTTMQTKIVPLIHYTHENIWISISYTWVERQCYQKALQSKLVHRRELR